MGDAYNVVSVVLLGAYLSVFVTSYEFITSNILGTNSTPSSFPRNFLFGTASSSYQFEGGFLADGKGFSNWDTFSHKPGNNIVDGSNGDIAVDHYHLYLEDLELMEFIGINTYRFSISWARILPKGRFGNVNIAGIKHYDKLINALVEKGIQPFVTLTHYDLPQELEDIYGGWLSSQIQQDFAYYASICFKYYGNRVKYWVTLNEPNVVAVRGYRSGIYPPARCSASFGNCTSGDSESEPFIAAHNMILSHAAAVDIYRTKYQGKQNGSIGIVMNAVWYEPISNSTQDRLAAQRALSFFLNWFLDPIIFGNYPEEMKDILGSLLPDFHNDSFGKLKNGLDFIGINHYTSFYAKDCLHSTCEQGGPGVSMTEGYFLRTAIKNNVPIGESTAVDWLNVYPEGMEKMVTYLKHRYNNTPMYITENGFGRINAPGSSIENFLNDDKRVEYMKSYLDALVSAIRKGADVRGYIAWSLLDNFEWLSGYTIRFGLYHVDYITLKRTPKSSAKWSSFLSSIMGGAYNLVLVVLLGAYLSVFVTSYEFINTLGTNSSPSSFPRNFLFGTASSSYQYEGGFLADGKGFSNWDIFSHKPGNNIVDGSNGDIAVDHYHLYLEDLELMKFIGINTYRFSISWARILPKGRFGNVNIAGIKHYDKLINALVEKGIQPFVTLTHYDLPQELEDIYGGWLSPQIQQDFAYYASICFKYYGDRVKYWVTLNEPNVVAVRGYRSGIYPPARCSASFGNCTSGDSESEPFIAAHNMIISHVAAVDIYRTKYQGKQNGSIGIVINAVWYEPISNSAQDRLAAQRALSFFLNWFLDPIIFGNYPEEMKDILGSLLPDFHNDSFRKLKNGLDFIGINHYTSFYAKDCLHSTCEQGGPGVSMTEGYFLRTAIKNNVPIGESTAVDWLNVYPEGMEKMVTYLKHRYNNTPMYITENGFGGINAPGSSIENFLNDDKRVEYMKSYLDALVSAIRKGADVRGYIAWSLLDNFEWLSGYTIRFGLYHVDYTTLKRTPKLSVKWYKQFISNSTSFEAVNF